MDGSWVETGAGAAARGRLTERQAETVARLVSTARDVLREQGYEGLTVRNVAAAAGVAPATAYTYFASKDHLIAEVFWRDLATVPPVERTDAPPTHRVTAALAPVSLLLVDEPTIAAAVTTAMLGSDPEVKRVRDRIGATLGARMTDALGDDADTDTVLALGLLFSGAMLQAGMGNLAYTDLPAVVARTTALLLGDAG